MLPGFVLALYGAAETRRRERQEVAESAYRVARLTATTHERTIQATHQLLRAMTRIPALGGSGGAQCATELTRVLADTTRFLGLGLVAADRRVICATALTTPGEIANADWFTRTIAADHFTVSPYMPGIVPGKGGIVVAVGFTAPAHGRRMLFAGLNPAALSDLATTIPVPDGTSINLIDRHGIVVARHPEHERWVGRNVSEVPAVQVALSRSDGSLEASGLDGMTRLFGFHRLEDAGDAGLTLMVGIPRHVAFAAANRRLVQQLGFLGIMATAAVLLTLLVSHRLILGTVDRLVRAVRRMSRGDLSARAGVLPGDDELTELSAAFDSMAATLQAREREANESSEAMRALALRTETVREQERTAIAREIHDQLGQNLTALRMDVDWIARALGNELSQQPKLEGKLRGMAELLDLTVPLVRNISRRLRPGVLDALGLRAALEWQLEEFGERAGLQTEFIGDFDDSRLSPEHATVVFRIFQETLTNIKRHASARTVTVHLGSDAEGAFLEVSDDGTGISERDAQNPRALGLLGMRERAQAIGGRVTIEGRPGRGTTVTAWVPLAMNESTHGAP